MIGSLRSWHRTGPKISAAVVILWGLTGFLHPIMSWTAPRAAIQMPPELVVETEGALAPSTVPALSGEARHVRLAPSSTGAYWSLQIAPGEPRVAIDAATGEDATNALYAHSVALARHYADLPEAEARSVRQITRFSMDYPAINRLLPVSEVVFDTPDRLAVYVDTGSDRLAAVSNTPRRVMLRIFQSVHTLAPLKPVEPLRLLVITGLTLAFLSTVIAGISMLWGAKGRSLRRWHRWAGAVLALPALAFPASGLFHAWVNSPLFKAADPAAEVFEIAALTALPGGSFTHLAASSGDEGPLWRGASGREARYWSASGEALPLSDMDRARQLAGAEGEVALQARFDGDYGFANKRLPVWRVETGAAPVFVDPVDGLIAGRITGPVAAIEQWTFNRLHKWNFADPLGRYVRDGAMMTTVLALIILALTGLMLARRRRRKS